MPRFTESGAGNRRPAGSFARLRRSTSSSNGELQCAQMRRGGSTRLPRATCGKPGDADNSAARRRAHSAIGSGTTAPDQPRQRGHQEQRGQRGTHAARLGSTTLTASSGQSLSPTSRIQA